MSKIAFVTGGSRGLGKDMALALARDGKDVVLTYHSKDDEAKDVVKQIRDLGQKADCLQLDVSKISNFDGFIDNLTAMLKNSFGSAKIDYIVNNAGIGVNAAYAETTEDQFDQMMNIHLKGVYFLTQKTLPHMNDGGAIVNITSGLTRFSFPGYAAYATMKGAVETLTSYLAKELGERKIRANCVAPGAIETDFGGGAVRDNDEINQMIAEQTALGRAGLPDDVGGVVAFLCSDAAKWVNGQRIEVSGGMLL